MKEPKTALHTLAERAGILPSYVEQSGREVRHTSDATRIALLAAMGFDASDEQCARQALEAWDARDRERLLPPVRVVRAEHATHIAIRVPGRRSGAVGWNLAQRMPSGEDVERAGRSAPDEHGILRLRLPVVPEPGYHPIRIRLHYDGQHPTGEQLLIVVPHSCPSPRKRLAGRKVFGLGVNLYAVRSERGWGAGDLTDLTRLVKWGAAQGAAFVGLNPLHALRNTGGDVSPYSPLSRIYRNPLYIDIDAVPEWSGAEAVLALIEAPDTTQALAELRDARWLDYERVWKLKSAVLEALYEAFRRTQLDRGTARARAFRDYVDREGRALDDFATFQALEEQLSGSPRERSWHDWPAEFRDPGTAEVAAFREQHVERVDYHRWLQFELDRQLHLAARAATSAGLSLGLYQDLAIGCAGDGSDAWANQSLLINGVNLGSPPDQYSDNGQDWGLPPINPHALVEQQYAYWIAVLREGLRHGGALRIDHILGLFRQFWIPQGSTGRDGAYVQFPTQDLLGILALEATRAGAIIVGEDLGTVPPEVPATLREWEILGTRVMYFERKDETGFKPSAEYDELALTVVNTHDHVPIAGFLAGRDIELRRHTGLCTAEAAAQALVNRDAERAALTALLQAEGLLLEGDPDSPTICGAVNAFVCATPSLMVALSLEDVMGEEEPVNVPAASQEAYPSWRRRLAMSLETLIGEPDVNAMLGACDARRR
ncbi:MAG TPA: 4-alpha-glucanotransferase [Gemmatimonadaceae bacterium]|nr:4-alpha-glucanotransferase [Gemmatimonadaceae bacterium]